VLSDPLSLRKQIAIAWPRAPHLHVNRSVFCDAEAEAEIPFWFENPAWYTCLHPCNARYLSVYSNRIHSKNAQQIFVFGGDRRADNDDNPRKWCFESFIEIARLGNSL
jgi:hypothetical protein